jgi:putative restriction endonuclease
MMMQQKMDSVLVYLNKFKRLRRDTSHGEPAPHKPILLISILEHIGKNTIQTNKIDITLELIATFRENWSLLAYTTRHEPNFILPYSHLRGDKFWHIVARGGFQAILDKSKLRTFNEAEEIIEYACFDKELYELLQNPTIRQEFLQNLLTTYFPESQNRFWDKNSDNAYLIDAENKVLHNTQQNYRAEYEQLPDEERFVRKGVFKKVVPRLYGYRCCISELKIDSLFDIAMVDACHIIPFSTSFDDTIKNGISLCPNLHRAFDRGIITIDQNYKVVISQTFVENLNVYGIRQFEGKTISLPNDNQFYPSLDNLAWHQQNIFKKL